MSGVAKRTKMVTDVPYKPKDTFHISTTKDSKSMPDCKLGEEVVVSLRVKITALRQDEYGKSLDGEILSVEKYKQKGS